MGMTKRDKARELLIKKQLSPKGIAKELGNTTATVIQYLCTKVGQGDLLLSDIYFSWRAEIREAMDEAARSGHEAVPQQVTESEFELFKKIRKREVFLGDMYQQIAMLEMTLHDRVRARLEEEFGEEERGWWRQGVP